MKYLLLLLIAFAGWKFYQSKSSPDSAKEFPLHGMAATGVQEIPEDQRTRVVLFTGTSWCPACKRLDQEVISRPAWEEFTKKEIKFIEFDVSRNLSEQPANVQKLVQQFGIRGYPTMIIVGPNNEKLDQMVGSGPPVENYKAWIRSHAADRGAVAAL